MSKGLVVSADLTLPLDAVTQAIAILARRGAGKTHTASVLVEEVVKARLPVVVLDPTGAWWGLRSSSDGTKPGLPVTVLGGEHGVVPLEATAGKVVADLVVDHPGAYVIDLSAFPSKASEQRFAADFLEQLYRAKASKREALLVVVDEADVFAPQRPGPEQTKTLGALESIVRRGRIRGLGVVLISQRAAVLNKNVLTQVEVLVAMQTTGPQDRAAIDAWIEGNGTSEERAEVLGSLAGLHRGEAWVWSPAWLRKLVRIHIRGRETFDSSKTPEAGEKRVEPRAFADVDLDQLGEWIRATAEQAKANDPAQLRRRIDELERQLARSAELPVTVERVVEVPVLNGEVDRLSAILSGFAPASGQLSDAAASIAQVANDVHAVATELLAAIGRATDAPARAAVAVAPRPAPRVEPRQQVSTPVRVSTDATDGKPLSKAERLILAALMQYPQGRTKVQAALLTGYAHNGGGFNNGVSALRSRGLIEGGKDRLVITDAGRDAIGNDWPPLPSGRALLEHWLPQLSKAERAVIEVLADAFPNAVPKEELGPRAGYEPSGGGFNNALSRLRTLELIERGVPRLSEDLA